MNHSFQLLPKKAVLALLCVFVMGNWCVGQTDINRNVVLPKIIAASPEAASLGKFGQIPVTNYRGLPNISIPMFTIDEGAIKLPIGLSYHAGGIKVEDMASNVGLGWALNAGGAITRSLKGLEDETTASGYFTTYNDVYRYSHGQMTTAQQGTFRVNVFNKNTDAEPDIFYFSLPDNAGKFFSSDSGKLYTSPRSDLKIEYNATDYFIITDGKGIKYKFSNRELTTTSPYCNGTNNEQYYTTTAFFLTSIQDPQGNTITFTYTNSSINFQSKSVATRNVVNAGIGCSDFTSYCYNLNAITRPTLSEINFSNGKIKFEYNTSARSDMSTDYSLKKISLINSKNDTIKSYRLYTGYYSTNSVGGCEDAITYRLRLDSVQEMGINNTVVAPHKFTYNTTSLPCRLSNAQDHWGYYNGKNNSVFVRYKNAANGPWVGADKEIDSNYTRAGMLEKITYPTGGRTEFSFESNRYSYYVPAAYDTVNTVFFNGLNGNNSNHEGNYLLNFQQNFTISSGAVPAPGYVLLKASLFTYVADPGLFSSIVVRVTGPNGYNNVIQNGDTLRLVAGNYSMIGTIETEFAGEPYAEFTLTLNQCPYFGDRYLTKLYGGVRIRRIQNFSESSVLADEKNFKYTSFDIAGLPDTASSADFSGLPDNSYYSYVKTTCPAPPGTCCTFNLYNSVSNYPLVNSGATAIGYRNVAILNGPGGTSGKQEYTYTSFTDYPDVVSFSMPFFFASEYDWKKGLLLKTTNYRYASGTYTAIQKKRMIYDFHSSDTTKKNSRGIVLGKTTEYAGTDSISVVTGLQVASYDLDIEAFNVKADTSFTYDQATPANYQVLVNTYAHSPKNFQLVKKKTFTNSKGDTLVTTHKYPLDYSASSANSNRGKSIWTLQNKNIVSTPIESFSSRIKSGTEYVMNGIVKLYRINEPLIDTVYNLETNGTTLMSSFQVSSVDGSNNFTFYPFYKAVLAQSRYTVKGKVAEVHKVSDVKFCYLWDYSGVLPIAEIKNADSASVAYTSFEAEGSGNWSIGSANRDSTQSVTGIKSYNLQNGNVSKSGLSSGTTYRVSYWSKNGSYTVSGSGSVKQGKTINSWTYYEHPITGVTSVTVSGSGTAYIDELRLYPATAQMTTYAYIPHKGLTHLCDIANKISYYVYDNLGRVKFIKDQDLFVLKVFDYQYQVSQNQ